MASATLVNTLIFPSEVIIKIKQNKTHEGMKNRIKRKAKHKLLNSFFHYYLEWATEYENLSKEYKESVLKQIKYVTKEG